MTRLFRLALIGGLGAAGLYLCFRLALPFLTPIVAAFVLAVLFSPLHRWVSGRLKSPTGASFLSVLMIAALVVAILVFLVAQIIAEAAAGAVVVRSAFESGLVKRLMSEHPTVAPLVQTAFEQFNAAGFVADAASWFTNVSASMLRGSVVQLVGLLLTFYLLFYFFRDRAKILAVLRSFMPFTEAETNLLFSRATDTVHATLFGMVIAGLVLGFIGGSIFAAVGLPAPVLWGVAMGLFALLPAVGIGMIWIPAALWLGLNGDWAKAIAMTVAFTAVNAVDVMIYPALVGNRMKLHTAVTFIAAIGGLIVFGAAGFVVGPLVVTLTITLKDIIQARANGGEAAVPAPNGPVR